MSKFKVGDKVRVIGYAVGMPPKLSEDAKPTHAYNVGEEGVVSDTESTYLDRSGYEVQVNFGEYKRVPFYNCELEIADE